MYLGDGYFGHSCVGDATGGVFAFGSATEEELLHAELDVERSRREKRLTERSHAFGTGTSKHTRLSRIARAKGVATFSREGSEKAQSTQCKLLVQGVSNELG
jgi:hypothetical protein